MQIEKEQGYLILAQNNSTVDYVACARALAYNLKQVDPDCCVCLLTDDIANSDQIFDYTKIFPFGDQCQDLDWKLKNDWQCFYASPFRRTIKLEADMLIPRSISYWFDICKDRDLAVTIGARNYHNQLASERTYRQVFDANNLPDVYNAITYWRLSEKAKTFFDTVRMIFENWQEAMSGIRYGTDQPINTDLAYALAIRLLDPEQFILPGSIPGMIHMKQTLNALESENWTRELVWEFGKDSFRINTVEQMWPVHYHIKEFAKEVENYYAQPR